MRNEDGKDEESETDVNFVIQCADIHACPVGAPAHCSDWTSDLERSDCLLCAFLSALPNLDCPIVRTGCDKFDPGSASECSVQHVNDATVSTNPAHALACHRVCQGERAIRGNGVQDGRKKGPL